jgi:hypothetical protein
VTTRCYTDLIGCTREIICVSVLVTTRCYMDEIGCTTVCNACNSRILETDNKDCFMKCGFPLVMSAAGWVAQFATPEDYPIYDSALEVCGIWSVIQVLDQHFLCHKKTRKWSYTAFLDALKRIASSHKIHQFDIKNNFNVMCNKIENELYRLQSLGEKKQKTD